MIIPDFGLICAIAIVAETANSARRMIFFIVFQKYSSKILILILGFT
jgi:hypothetical protein